MTERVKFKDIKVEGKFVHNSCLFVKESETHAKMGGASTLTPFDGDLEVGEVVLTAFAPGHGPEEASPEIEEETTVNENPDEKEE